VTELDSTANDADGVARRRLRSTAIFAGWTAVSRVAGLAREILAAALFGTTGLVNAFTLAFQVPNLLRSLVADSALSAAFIPVFTELEENDQGEEARRLVMTLAALFSLVIGLITLVAILIAPWVMPAIGGFEGEAADKLVLYTQIMFPIVPLLALTGLVMAVLQIGGKFGVTAFAPVLWNVLIIAVLVLSVLTLDGDDRLIGYAVGIVVGTLGQLLFLIPFFRSLGPFPRPRELWNEHVQKVIVLMLPVVIGLGLINVNLVVGSSIASEVNPDEGVQPLNFAFRLYLLPQGIFSVAVSTVLFPDIGRLAARKATDALRRTVTSGLRQIFVVLVPASVGMILLAEPIVRLVFEYGEFDAGSTDITSGALVFYSLGLAFNGASLLLIRTFFGLQKPWLPTAVAGVGAVLFAPLAIGLAEVMEIDGIALATSIVSLVTFVVLFALLRRELGGMDTRLLAHGFILSLAIGLIAGALAFAVWTLLDDVLGRAHIAQVVSMSGALLAGVAAFAVLAFVTIPEVRGLVRTRLSLR
jgi:putative peptidoglycan lipid II flippase